MSQVVGLPSNSYKPITNTAWVRAWLCKLQKGCTRLAAASDKVYQLLAHGRWFFPGTPASSTTKTGRHDIAEVVLKVALNTTNQFNQFITITGSIQLSLDKQRWIHCRWTISSPGYHPSSSLCFGTAMVYYKYSQTCIKRSHLIKDKDKKAL